MKRIAVVGGGIAGLSAAYEFSVQQRAGAQIEFVLFEAAGRLGGIVETECRDGFVIECGPDSWVTEKPWARELAVELGLERDIIPSQDKWRKTYLAEGESLTPMPDGMRMMVPVEWASVLNSSLFSWQAKLAYLREPKRADELKANALDAGGGLRDGGLRDESVRNFVLRHFGPEVADTIAAPLLAGVFGGDIGELSARAVLPAYVAMEREYGSLILALQERVRSQTTQPSVFTSLRHGLGGLIEGMQSRLPAASVRMSAYVETIEREEDGWRVRSNLNRRGGVRKAVEGVDGERFDAVLVATPAKTTSHLLGAFDTQISALLPQHSSSAIVVALGFIPERARSMSIPRGFGFLVPQYKEGTAAIRTGAQRDLMACTFMDQKFSHRAPDGGILLRAFFGGFVGSDAPTLMTESDASFISLAHAALGQFLGTLPDPDIALVRRWPDSLPLYAVGHLERIAEMEKRVALLPCLRLIGNAYRGVGLPDLIRAGRDAAREMVVELRG